VNLHVERVRPASDREWDRAWYDCDYATFFHGREWAELWQVYTRGRVRPAPRVVELSDRTTVLLPLSHQRDWNGERYFSSLAYTYGGWISSADLGPEHARVLSELLRREFGGIVWRLNPYDPCVPTLKLPTWQPDTTHVLDLSLGLAALRRRWTRSHRSAENQARRFGISVRRASTRSDWERYYELYQSTLARWGDLATSRYGQRLFRAMARRNSPDVGLWLAEAPGVGPVAGTVALYSRNHVIVWHGVALAEYFPLRPANLLYVEVMKHGEAAGYRWFDFNPSGGHAGVEAFKRSFGAEERICPLVFLEPRRGRVAAVFRRLTQMIARFGSSAKKAGEATGTATGVQ